MSAEKLSLDDPAPAPRVGGETRYEFDELLNREVGTFGRRQQLLCFLLILSHACLAFHSLAPVFIAGSPEHWCSIETGAFSNCTLEQLKSLTIPRERKDGEVSFSRCARFASNASRENGAEDEVFTCGGAGQALNETSGRRTEACESWDYDDHYFSKTIVNEWDMVCDKAGLASTVAAVFMIGRIIGCIFAGQLADRFGRRGVLIATLALHIVSSFACAAMPNYLSFLVMRLLMAIFSTAAYNTAIIIAVELVGKEWRVCVTSLWMFVWATGYAALTGLAFSIRDWRALQAVITVPDAIILALWVFFIPESPRWLLVQNRQKEAMKILRDIAAGNGRTLPEGVTATAEEETSSTYLDLLRTPAIRWTSILLFYSWFANSFVYYGLSLNSSDLGGDPYINFLLTALVEFPAYAYIWWSYTAFDRLRPFAISFLTAGVALLLIMAAPPHMNWLVMTFAMTGKLAVTASFGMVWIYSIEVYPTSIRAIGVNMCSSFARFASVPASYVGLLSSISRELPLLIYGAMAIIGGALVFVLPETRDQPMRQTVQEGEKFIRENMCNFGACKRCKRGAVADAEPPPESV